MGRAEIKRLCARFIDKDHLPPIEMLPGLEMELYNYRDHNRLFWWFEEMAGALYFYQTRYLPAGGTYIDVGASSGLMGFLAARLKSARVIAFEPVPSNIEIIRKSVLLNPAWADLYELIPHPCSPDRDPKFPDFQSVRLDTILNERKLEHVDLVKIDTDGHDIEVLESMGAWLDPARVDALFVEMDASDPVIFNRMRDKGYEPFAAKHGRLPQMLKRGMNQMDSEWFLYLPQPPAKNEYEDILWVAASHPLAAHFKRFC